MNHRTRFHMKCRGVDLIARSVDKVHALFGRLTGDHIGSRVGEPQRAAGTRA